ncbi:MAG TPA: RNA polymerase sigma factor [Solirubrobacteraceae bacterium]|nr:RNA polymerase sigma factor [Solirubrobacteraceae bacterium]
MEVSALNSPTIALRGPSPFLRLQSDDRLVALTRRGNQAAYEALVSRYSARITAFTRHMLGSKEDAEDVTQDTFAAAYNAMIADERPLNVKPWLYRIARNRSLNHMRRQQAIGVDSFDHHVADHGQTVDDTVHKREDFRLLMSDIGELPETQRTALLLREIDALSYEQIAEAMETTVPSVKSLLVRARVSLAEAAEARRLSCEEVREELGEVAEGLARMSPPVRRHLRDCERCSAFRKSLKDNNKALALMLPIGPLLLLKKLTMAQLGTSASAGGGAAAAGSAAAVTTAGSAGAGSALSAGVATIASKAAATVAAAAIVTAGAVEVNHATTQPSRRSPVSVVAQAPAAPARPRIVVAPRPVVKPATREHSSTTAKADSALATKKPDAATTTPATTTPAATTAPAAPAPPPATTTPTTPPASTGGPQEQVDNVELPPSASTPATPAPPVTSTPAPPVTTTPAPQPPVTTTPDPVPPATTPADPAPPVDPAPTPGSGPAPAP